MASVSDTHPTGSDAKAPSTLSVADKVLPMARRAVEPSPISDPPASAAPSEAARNERQWLRPLLFALLPIALIIGGYIYVTGGAIMTTDNAYVQADVVGVSNDIAGIVSQVLVRDNQKVAKGDMLFRIDDEPFRLALNRAEAQLGSIRNDLLALSTGYKSMQAQIEQAKADIALNTLTFERQQKLAVNNFIAQAQLDIARNALQSAQQKLASLEAQLAGIAANLNGDAEAPVENHPRYKDALAARDEAARQLAHTVVRAPFDGIVTNVPSLQPGQYLASATTAFNVVSTDHVWIQASPKETELTSVEPGQKAIVDRRYLSG